MTTPWIRWTLALLAVLAGAARGADEVTTQLPRGVRPLDYEIALTIADPQQPVFDGRAAIAIEVERPTKTLTLHAHELGLRTASLDGRRAAIRLDEKAQTAVLSFAKPVAAGAHRLAIEWSGRINSQPIGLFALDYVTANGPRRALFTQFEAAEARRVFPSWDEPNFKATFSLSVTAPAALVAVSNMPVEATLDAGPGLSTRRFQRTPKMSSYLLFLGLGEFERAALATARGTGIGVVVQQGKAGQGRFALESSAAIVDEYERWFDVPYPLPKLDTVGGPGRSTFFGAMENWGAIFTFEHALLLEPAIATEADRRKVFAVAAHEIAHQWFGDLVTMKWWGDLWLNEGFATWMEAHTTAKLHPEWNSALDAVSTREGAMRQDAYASTHPIVQRVETVEQAEQAFDGISYAKGRTVIGMLEAFVGEPAWRDGVRRYIKAHAYGNTVTDDLWREVEAVAQVPIAGIAHDFTLQPGIPLLAASSRCEDGRTTVEIVQREYARDRPGKAPLRWRVPVVAQAVGGGSARTVVEGGKGSLQLEGCAPVLLNAGQRGYYRVKYEPAHFAALRGAFRELPAIDQLGLLRDVWELAQSGVQPVGDYLALAGEVAPDAEPKLWDGIAGDLAGIDRLYVRGSPGQQRFRAHALGQLQPAFARLGWEPQAGEAPPVKELRSALLGALSDLGDEAVIAEARRRWAAQPTDPQALPVELRRRVLSIVATHADASTWDRLHAQAQAETSALLRETLYAALGEARDETLARRALDLALTPEPGATASPGIVRAVALEHPELAWDFAFANRQRFDAMYEGPARYSGYAYLLDSTLDPAMLPRLRAYIEADIPPGARRRAEGVAGNIEFRIRQRAVLLPAIDAWLAGR